MPSVSFTPPKNSWVSLITSNIGTILLIVAAFLVGSLWTEVRYLKNGTAATPSAATTTTTTTAGAQPTAQPVSLAQVKDLFNKGNNIKFGDANKKVLFVEISDPSCPYCHAAGGVDGPLNKAMGDRFTLTSDGGTYLAPVPEMKKLVDEGKAGFVWIYYPGHGNGQMATKALYCAYEKGKFWQAHDLLMNDKGYELLNGTDVNGQPTKGPIVKNDTTKSGDLAQFLKDAVDPSFMKSCLDSGKYDSRLQSDSALATTMGVQGTPGFYINTTAYPGAYSFTDMKAAVDAALK